MNRLDDNTKALLKVLWDYNKLGGPPQAADFLLVMGTNDTAVPEYALRLAQEFLYRQNVVSGGVSHKLSLRGLLFGDTEANYFAKVLIAGGVDPVSIIVENGARNTGENITLARTLLLAAGHRPTSGHLVHTPSMERRALATAERQWPEVAWSVSSPPGDFESDLENIDEVRFAHGLVGDTFRILDYPVRGFQTVQNMPENVMRALDELIALGYRNRIPANVFSPL